MRLLALIGTVFILGGLVVFYSTKNSADAPVHGVQETAGQEGAPLVEVIVPEGFSQNAQLGRKGFEAVCASCHGVNAAGKDGFGPPLVHKIYEPNHHGDEAFQMAVARGVPAHHWRFGDMPPQQGLSRQDVAYITEYIRELQRANGIN